MRKKIPTSAELLHQLQNGNALSIRRSILLVVLLSLPTIAAQFSYIVMQYIDAAMVGHLSTQASASIGLISPVTWLFQGLCAALTAGFSVQMAQRFGSQNDKEARNIMKQGFIIGAVFSAFLCAVIVSLSFVLPTWLGGAPEIRQGATEYLSIFGISIFALQVTTMGSTMVQSSGNMKLPGFVSVVMCLCDVLFNSWLIFPPTTYTFFGLSIPWFGANMGVAGAAAGTGLAELVGALIYLWYMFTHNDLLRLRTGERVRFRRSTLMTALRIGTPVAIENAVTNSAQVMSTKIIAPLGTTAIAANSFAVTAESICYQPGFGIGTAATAIVGQSIGAHQKRMARRFAWLSIGLGMLTMTAGAVVLFIFAPQMIGLLSPDLAIQDMGGTALRIGMIAEPFFAASIVSSAALRGAGDTFASSLFNAGTIWAIRVPLSVIFCPLMGINGYWLACVIQWWICGSLFLWRVKSGVWLKRL
ncbi:MATE family efflux transporter [Alloscardovia criceti]|uniref:MATE family efflux transporter n=1 Tax=Alloscardovia criceti TaxID=356828 RepID=UPI0003653F9A|nr:MATE family efflux transporter [Alloscardovia criceti]